MKDDYDSSYRAKAFPAASARSGSDDEGDDDETAPINTKPIVVEVMINSIEYKFLPDRMRQMILAEFVYCTDPITRVFPGCTATMDTTIDRGQAFWLALCRCVIITV